MYCSYSTTSAWRQLVLYALLAFRPSVVESASVLKDVKLTWQEATADMPSAILANGQFPPPTLYFENGDEVEVKLRNAMAQKTTMHWHGDFARHTPSRPDTIDPLRQMDLQPDQIYTFRFTASTPVSIWFTTPDASHTAPNQDPAGHTPPPADCRTRSRSTLLLLLLIPRSSFFLWSSMILLICLALMYFSRQGTRRGEQHGLRSHRGDAATLTPYMASSTWEKEVLDRLRSMGLIESPHTVVVEDW